MNNEFWQALETLRNYKLVSFGSVTVTPETLLYLLVLTVLLFWFSKRFTRFLIERLLGKTQLDIGARVAIGTIARYLILFVGLLVILQSAGIDLTAFNVLAGAVGIGVGFGLQNIASNFISGLIILLERPVKVGDRIEVGDIDGKVIAIGARSTRVRTNDNITIIVPNSNFIEQNVINWSFEDQSVRFRLPIGVAYESDLGLVKKLLLEVAAENADVLKDPGPAVRLIEFGDSSINLQLWVWTRDKLHRRTVFLSALNFAVWEKFAEHGIEIPFPQRDLHVKTGEVKIRRDAVRVAEPEPDDFNEMVEQEPEVVESEPD